MKKAYGEQSTIMLVDDDLDLLEVIKDRLVDFFSSVLIADRAKKAIEILKTNHVDCIITDYRMPEMNGLEFIDIVSKTHPSIPIILLTGNSGDPEVIKAIENGLFDFLEKPYNEFILVNRIRNALILPKLESLIIDLAGSEFPDLKIDRLQTSTPAERLKSIAGLEAMIRVRLQARKSRKLG